MLCFALSSIFHWLTSTHEHYTFGPCIHITYHIFMSEHTDVGIFNIMVVVVTVSVAVEVVKKKNSISPTRTTKYSTLFSSFTWQCSKMRFAPRQAHHASCVSTKSKLSWTYTEVAVSIGSANNEMKHALHAGGVFNTKPLPLMITIIIQYTYWINALPLRGSLIS